MRAESGLGYTVKIQDYLLEDEFPQWGKSHYYHVELSHFLTLKELLTHLYVLIPALDYEKHYYIHSSEIEKLLRKGKGWLENHPYKEEIAKRYLINIKSLTEEAIDRLNDNKKKIKLEKSTGQKLSDLRNNTIIQEIKKMKLKNIIDLGCGEGNLIRHLLQEKELKKITGMDVSYSVLLRAKEKIITATMPLKQKEKIFLFQGSLLYKDKRLLGYDGAVVSEVIEHIEISRLRAFEKNLFGWARPKVIIITTPNKEYNNQYSGMEEYGLRHEDHRFEWTREEFTLWSDRICQEYGYRVSYLFIGDVKESVGAPTQMGVFIHEN